MNKKDVIKFRESIQDMVELENPNATKNEVLKKVCELLRLNCQGYSFSEISMVDNGDGTCHYQKSTNGESIYKIPVSKFSKLPNMC